MKSEIFARLQSELTDSVLHELEILDRGLRDSAAEIQTVAVCGCIPPRRLVSQIRNGIHIVGFDVCHDILGKRLVLHALAPLIDHFKYYSVVWDMQCGNRNGEFSRQNRLGL